MYNCPEIHAGPHRSTLGLKMIKHEIVFVFLTWAIINGFVTIWDMMKISKIEENTKKYEYDLPNRINKSWKNNKKT